MNNSLALCRVQRIGHFDRQRQQCFGPHRLARDAVLQRYPVQKLHGDESLAVLFANVINRANVGVIQRRGSLCLTLKTGQSLGISGNFIGQELEGNKTAQPRVFRFLHHTHPTSTELLDDAVVRDGLANH